MEYRTNDLLARFRALILERSGIALPLRRLADLERQLRRLQTDTGLTAAALYEEVSAGGALWDQLIMRVTIGETYFFRNSTHFQAFREFIFPSLFHERDRRGPVRIWSAGCATGEEPYSLAIAWLQLGLPMGPDALELIASDINADFLERARYGSYGAWSFRDTPEAIRAAFFAPVGEQRWQVAPAIRAKVAFQHHNLLDSALPAGLAPGGADLIICRNVMIYFDQGPRYQLVDQLYRALRPGGWLVVGQAEPDPALYGAFIAHHMGATVLYQRPLQALQRPARQLPVRLQPLPWPLSPAQTSVLGADHAQQVRTLLAQGLWSEAEALARTLVAADPNDAEALALLGEALECRGDLAAAQDAYQRSLELNGASLTATLGLAQVWRRIGRFQLARSYYAAALDILKSMAPDAPSAPGSVTASSLISLIEHQLHYLPL